MVRWLVLDTNNLAHRAFHAMPNLRRNEILTSVMYGVLRDVVSLQERFDTNLVCWCFDLGWPHRHALLPTYKQKRRDKFHHLPKKEKRLMTEMRDQINKLRMEYLPTIGFKNVFAQEGYEADDTISVVVGLLKQNEDTEVIIVTEDKDLYQCLSHNVRIWNPRKRRLYTRKTFQEEWNLKVRQWSEVKAVAGCTSDDIPGVIGVGEKTAAKYLRGDLKGAKKESIESHLNQGIIIRNRILVQLPFPGAQTNYLFQDDRITKKSWRRFCKRFGLRSLINRPPIPNLRKRVYNDRRY